MFEYPKVEISKIFYFYTFSSKHIFIHCTYILYLAYIFAYFLQKYPIFSILWIYFLIFFAVLYIFTIIVR